MVKPGNNAILFFYEVPTFGLRNRSKLKRFIESIFEEEKKDIAALNYIFCSDERLLKLNRQYLKHNYYTDVISFEFSAASEPTHGEIYISVDRVRENSKALNEPFQRELHRAMFHGALHLCNYKDKTKSQKTQMRRKEEFYLNKYFSQVPRGTVS